MATYTIVGHPLNYADLATTPGGTVDANLKANLQTNGVGKSVTLTLAGPDATKVTGHSILR
jgi:hypothetical protein